VETAAPTTTVDIVIPAFDEEGDLARAVATVRSARSGMK
jgi:hypothetical protein